MNLNAATSYRLIESDQGMESLFLHDSFKCNIFELPWRNNERNISCIPSGIYNLVPAKWRGKDVFLIKDVDGRTGVLTHWGNFAGDVLKGFKSDTLGCLLTGSKWGWINGQRAVLLSRVTFRNLWFHFNGEPFTLQILDGFRRT